MALNRAVTLSEVDDITSGLILDTMLGLRTHKMALKVKGTFLPPTLDFDSVFHVLQKYRCDGDELSAIQSIFDLLPGFEDAYLAQRGPKAVDLLREVACSYVRVFHPESGLLIVPCSRYSCGWNGAKVIATREWSPGQQLHSMCGFVAELTPQEEATHLRVGENDFSVMFSTRRNRSQLWLGPAAFLNHDCEPNCKLNPVDGNMVKIYVLAPVFPGDEISCHYGKDFFGDGNAHCCCRTCERKGCGAFRKETPTDSPPGKYSLRKTNRQYTLSLLRQGHHFAVGKASTRSSRRSRSLVDTIPELKTLKYFPLLMVLPKENSESPRRTFGMNASTAKGAPISDPLAAAGRGRTMAPSAVQGRGCGGLNRNSRGLLLVGRSSKQSACGCSLLTRIGVSKSQRPRRHCSVRCHCSA